MSAETIHRVLRWGAIVSWVLAASPVQAQESFPDDSALQAMLDEGVRKGLTVGVVMGLLEPDGSRRVLSAGVGGPGAVPLDGETVFEIGSVTKVFTATALADMALRGEVSLDQPVAELLPPNVKVPDRSGKPITLLLLSTHFSALPRLPANWIPADMANPYADYTVQKMYDFLASYTLPYDPGERYVYSNFGFGLLGHALAREAGTTYEALIRERILGPLGMDHTAIELTPWMESHLAMGHDEYGDPAVNWDIPALAGGGALRSTVNDMLEFAAANLSDSAGTPFAAMDSTHRPRQAISAGNADAAMAWVVSHRGEATITGHNGRTGGYRSFIGLDLEGNRAVVLLTNTSGDGLDDLGMHLLDPSFPLRRPAVRHAVARVWRSEGVEAGVSLYRHLRETERGAWSFSGNQLDSFGRWLLRRGDVEDAIAILRLNAETFSDSPTPRNSLGDAYREAGRLEEARDSYAMAVELTRSSKDPNAARYRANLRAVEQALEDQ